LTAILSPPIDPRYTVPMAEDVPADFTRTAPPARGLHRRLYDWVMSWADSRHGMTALAGLSFAESSVFPVPPDVLLIALGIGQPRRAFRFAAVCTVASVAGGLFGYLIGWVAWDAVSGVFFAYVPGFDQQIFARVQGYYLAYGFLAVAIAGFTPIPFKVFTIASGVFGMNVIAFVGAATLSRGLRFFIESALIVRFGPRMREVIERNFNLMTLLFTVLLVGGFAVLRLWMH
jgi:membrane protein YqaA with SNARE-associated domain